MTSLRTFIETTSPEEWSRLCKVPTKNVFSWFDEFLLDDNNLVKGFRFMSSDSNLLKYGGCDHETVLSCTIVEFSKKSFFFGLFTKTEEISTVEIKISFENLKEWDLTNINSGIMIKYKMMRLGEYGKDTQGK